MNNRRKTIWVILLAALVVVKLHAGDTLVYWAFDKPDVAKEMISGDNYTILTTIQPVETVPGVKGDAVRFDGYSTHLTGVLSQALPAQSLCFSAWFALEAYPVPCNEDCGSDKYGILFHRDGFLIGIDRFGKVHAEFKLGASVYKMVTDTAVKIFEWVNIVVAIDPAVGNAKLFLNGQKRAEIVVTLNSEFVWSADASVLIGKHPAPAWAGPMMLNMVNGIIDEVVITNVVPSESQVLIAYSAINVGKPDLIYQPQRYEGNLFRTHFHPAPMSGWTNEAHGLVYHKGKYHMFFQKTSQPYKLFMNWGHLESSDLVNWVETKPALWPEPGIDEKGIWSGACVIDDNGVPTIMYTAVDFARARMIAATSNDDMIDWQKHKETPAVAYTPGAYYDFRDPYIFKEGNEWIMIIGSGFSKSGLLLAFASTDMKSWTFKGELFKSPEPTTYGNYWEMPVMMKFGEKYVLIINTLPNARAKYWVGTYKDYKFIPDSKTATNLDLINIQLAPTIAQDEFGRYIGIGILPSTGASLSNDMSFHADWGFANVFGLPRVMSLDEKGKLCQQPIPELQSLRKSSFSQSNFTVTPEGSNYIDFSGRQIEIKVKIKNISASKFGITVAKNADNSEYTKVYYDFSNSSINVDRRKSSTYTSPVKDLQSGKYQIAKDSTLEINLFFDNSTLDVFLDNHDAFATRIFPKKELSNLIDLYAEGGEVFVESISVWEMSNNYDTTYTLTAVGESPECIYIDVPATTINKIGNNGHGLNVFPNPSNGKVNYSFTLNESANVTVNFFNIQGKLLKSANHNVLHAGVHNYSLNLFENNKVATSVCYMRVVANGNLLGCEKILLISK